MILYQVTTRKFCAGIVTDDTGKITHAAPCFRWSVGLGMRQFIQRATQAYRNNLHIAFVSGSIPWAGA